MNALLSLFIAMAMLIGGVGATAPQPETAVSWTLSNLTITANDESVTLAPEARLTTAIGTEKLQMAFDIQNDGRTFLPAAGEITPDGIRFSLGSSDRTYTLSADTLAEITDMPEDLQPDMSAIFVLMMDYMKLLGSLSDASPEEIQATAEVLWNLLLDSSDAKFEDATATIDSQEYPAKHARMDFNAVTALKLLDGLRSCGLSEWEDLSNDALALLSVAMEKTYDSYSQIVLELTAEDMEFSFPMELTYVEAEDMNYVRMGVDFAEDDIGLRMEIESYVQDEVSHALVKYDLSSGYSSMRYEMEASMVGPADAYESMEMTLNAAQETTFDHNWTDENEVAHSQSYCNTQTTQMHVQGTTHDGLEDLSGQMNVTNDYQQFDDGQRVSGDSSSVVADFAGSQTLGADGEKISDFSLSMNVPGLDTPIDLYFTLTEREEADDKHYGVELSATDGAQNYGLSFDLTRSEAPFEDLLAGGQEYAVTSDEESDVLTMVSADAMNFASDAMALSADDSVMELVRLFAADANESELPDEDEQDWHEPANVSSYEEAADIFEGKLPEFEVPEEYTLQSIEVDDYSFLAEYASGERSFTMTAYAYTADGLEYYALQDGALQPAENGVVEISRYDEGVDSATLYTPDSTIYFYFENFTFEEASAILEAAADSVR